VLTALLDTLPVEFSITDANDKVIVWNRHDTRLFKRSPNVIGRDVRACHPRQSLDKVERILSEMKAGTRESAEFWIDMKVEDKLEKVLIQYFALRDPQGKFLGCMECSQKISRLRSLTGQQRLLD
jgi:DUF438 domain-containing protein